MGKICVKPIVILHSVGCWGSTWWSANVCGAKQKVLENLSCFLGLVM